MTRTFKHHQGNQSVKIKEKIVQWYEQNEKQADMAFFIGGFLFDILTLSDIDDTLSLVQQFFYLIITAFILYYQGFPRKLA